MGSVPQQNEEVHPGDLVTSNPMTGGESWNDPRVDPDGLEHGFSDVHLPM